MTRESRARALLYALFTLSGFAGLIYESIWSHYLKLFLGHAAYAQTLVLVIFMGGMAIGSWIAGQWTPRLANPLRLYALVEGALGLGALAFDPLFRGMQSWMFDTVIPALDAPLAIELCKWSASATIVLPQSILLGATFPLISAGVIRLEPSTHGRALGWLYFTNSIGASVGVLVSGFLLIGMVGLPGTIACAGAINFALAGGMLLLARRLDEALVPASSGSVASTAAGKHSPIVRRMLIVAFLTGMASFCYEIGWLRMLALVLGSATHAFELMLSAFILGIALGSFSIRTHIDSSPRPLRLLAWIQVAMATAALVTLAVYNQSFDWMSSIIRALQTSQPGYVLFNLLSHAICMAIMLPVTIFAGMTLPLITSVMLRERAGESGIGRIYAANTLGSIAGVLFAVHLAMPEFGLRQVVIAGAFIDMGVGLWLFRSAEASPQRTLSRLGIGAAVAAAAYVALFVHFDPLKLASGVYRYGDATRANSTILFHGDGKTASVDVFRGQEGIVAIATNGKPDAGFIPGPHGNFDDYTMMLAGLLPALQLPEARHAAVIGIGSGRTTHTLLTNPAFESVDTIEIEPNMLKGARQFGEFSHLAFDDPRSHLHVEDAKTYFAHNRSRYDLIVAEPSNPWVSGVSSLFSKEFYRQIQRHLSEDGLFVQWVQIYEIDIPLVATIIKALEGNFDDYAIYATSDSDILIVARPHGSLPPLSPSAFDSPVLSKELAYIDIDSLTDINDRRIGTRATLSPYFNAFPFPANSDYFPILDQNAVRDRFMHIEAKPILKLRRASARLESNNAGAARLSRKHDYHEGIYAQQAQLIAGALAGRTPADVASTGFEDDTSSLIATLQIMDRSCDEQMLSAVWLPAFLDFGTRLLPYLSKDDAADIFGRMHGWKCYAQAPQKVRNWTALLESAGTENWQGVRQAGDVLIAAQLQDLPSQMLVAREVLLADIKLGDYKGAVNHAGQFSPLVFREPPVEYLRAYAAAKAGKG